MGRPGAWGTWGPPRLGHGGHRLHIGEYFTFTESRKDDRGAGGRSHRDHLQRGHGKHIAACPS